MRPAKLRYLCVFVFFLCAASSQAATVQWTATGTLLWDDLFFAPTVGEFSVGDLVEFIFRIEDDATPIVSGPFTDVFAPDFFSVTIGSHEFTSANANAALGVDSPSFFQFSVSGDTGFPAPGYWLEQIAFAFFEGSFATERPVPTAIPPGADEAFDFDLHYPSFVYDGNTFPAGHLFGLITDRNFSVTVIPLPPAVYFLLTGLTLLHLPGRPARMPSVKWLHYNLVAA